MNKFIQNLKKINSQSSTDKNTKKYIAMIGIAVLNGIFLQSFTKDLYKRMNSNTVLFSHIVFFKNKILYNQFLYSFSVT